MERILRATADILVGTLIVCAVSLLGLALAGLVMSFAFGPTLGFD